MHITQGNSMQLMYGTAPPFAIIAKQISEHIQQKVDVLHLVYLIHAIRCRCRTSVGHALITDQYRKMLEGCSTLQDLGSLYDALRAKQCAGEIVHDATFIWILDKMYHIASGGQPVFRLI